MPTVLVCIAHASTATADTAVTTTADAASASADVTNNTLLYLFVVALE
jgi:hypothetical protein